MCAKSCTAMCAGRYCLQILVGCARKPILNYKHASFHVSRPNATQFNLHRDHWKHYTNTNSQKFDCKSPGPFNTHIPYIPLNILTVCQIRLSALRQHSPPVAGMRNQGETHRLSNQAIGLPSALPTDSRQLNYQEETRPLSVRAIGLASAITTGSRHEESGNRQGNHPGETHRLSDQAIGVVSALATGIRDEESGRNSLSVASRHRACVSTSNW
jgi:hypothetical protein